MFQEVVIEICLISHVCLSFQFFAAEENDILTNTLSLSQCPVWLWVMSDQPCCYAGSGVRFNFFFFFLLWLVLLFIPHNHLAVGFPFWKGSLPLQGSEFCPAVAVSSFFLRGRCRVWPPRRSACCGRHCCLCWCLLMEMRCRHPAFPCPTVHPLPVSCSLPSTAVVFLWRTITLDPPLCVWQTELNQGRREQLGVGDRYRTWRLEMYSKLLCGKVSLVWFCGTEPWWGCGLVCEWENATERRACSGTYRLCGTGQAARLPWSHH